MTKELPIPADICVNSLESAMSLLEPCGDDNFYVLRVSPVSWFDAITAVNSMDSDIVITKWNHYDDWEWSLQLVREIGAIHSEGA